MTDSTLAELAAPDAFVRRHIGPGPDDIRAMLDAVGADSLEALIDTAVPAGIRAGKPLDAPARTEAQVLARARQMASKNKLMRSLIGLGYHDCLTPPVIQRNVLENPGWYTAYTPYQAEISQGRMEVLITFQQMCMDLCGMELANASMLDEATAAAEAAAMMKRAGKNPSDSLFIAADCHPQTIAVVRTRMEALGFTVIVGDAFSQLDPGAVFGALVQYPATDGSIHDYAAVAARLHDAGALLTVAADILSLALLKPPGEWGADIVVGNSQRFGVPLGFGGPHAAFFATHDRFKRSVPGRLIGVSIDSQGNPAYRLALQTREQHIRREKANSNICTAQVLLANMAALYAVYHGPGGIALIAERVHRLTAALAHHLGGRVETALFFDSLTIATGPETAAVHDRARAAGFNLRPVDDARVGLSLDETTTIEEVIQLLAVFGVTVTPDGLEAAAAEVIPGSLRRGSDFLSHPVFNTHHSETGMMRYLRGLEEKDLALNRAMIPLGSCTMKLNAAVEMMPVSWPEFAGIHPFAPLDQAQGYMDLIGELEAMLADITGFEAISLQPNAGSQGEYAGLMCIRRYHQAHGQGHRNVCLIPSSAHGTNPASASMAAMRVVVVDCDEAGNVDVEDLRAKAGQHADNLAALMVTYPSTHGVFEEAIGEICQIIHDAGGQVYLDGANLQAMVGVSRPGRIGPDVAHLNLHKTFAIPHGGGGPGVGPIGVGAHLAPYLPNHPLVAGAGPKTGLGPIAAAPWGSAGILVISWAYISLMGGAGLTRATQVAILGANYIAKRLAGHYNVLYTGRGGLVAHECILDTRPLKDAAGITVEDVAKRLIDYGFHAPTMSWPVAGTLMVEPTESEPKQELDRFIEAMTAIAGEAARVRAGEWPADDNPLVNAPHTAEMVLADDWPHAYGREVAAFPVAGLRRGKYWAPVGRVDNVHGDRHLVCSCPALDSYREAAE